VWPNYFGIRHVGAIRSAVATRMIAAAAMGPFQFGWIADLTGSCRATVALFVILPMAAAVAGLAARPPRK
jgi:hypothetical protein